MERSFWQVAKEYEDAGMPVAVRSFRVVGTSLNVRQEVFVGSGDGNSSTGAVSVELVGGDTRSARGQSDDLLIILSSNVLDRTDKVNYANLYYTTMNTNLLRIRPVIIRSVVSLALIAITGLLIAWMMISDEIPQVPTAVAVPIVEVVPIQRHETGIDFAVDGEVIPFRRIDLIAEVQGRVVYKSERCRLGQYVEQDELLLRIDPVDHQLTLDQAETAVRQAKVNIDENEVQRVNAEKELVLAQGRLELIHREYARQEQLFARNTNTRADLDNAKSNVLSTQESVQRLENQLRVLNTQLERLNAALRRDEIALETAKLNLARTEIRAPISGIITSDSFEVNSFILRGANVARILDTSQLEIQCSLHMRQIQWIWRQSNESTGYVFPPTPVTILYEVDGERWAWEGNLKTLDGGMMNPTTRMVPCRVRVENPQAGKRLQGNSLGTDVPPTLFAGMFVTVIIHSTPDIPLLRIPERALLPGNRIWTVHDGKLRQHSIRIATTTPEGVLFYADSDLIQPFDLVVVSPLASPTEGSSVQTVQYASAGYSKLEYALYR